MCKPYIKFSSSGSDLLHFSSFRVFCGKKGRRNQSLHCEYFTAKLSLLSLIFKYYTYLKTFT